MKNTTKKVFVTEKGSKMPSNTWKQGQEINCSISVANEFIKNGIAVETEEKTSKTNHEEKDVVKTKKHKAEK